MWLCGPVSKTAASFDAIHFRSHFAACKGVHEGAMAARPKVTQFRVRPWPVPVGCEADLRAKREVTTLSVEVDPALDFKDQLEMLEWHIDLREYQRARSSETVAPPRAGEDLPRTFDLFAQESWRSEMWGSCHMPVDEHQLMNAEADAAFADLKARMCNGWMVGEDTCAAVRQMVRWLMEHDLDGLKFLLQQGLLHVGNDLFPPCTQEWHSHFVGEAESLLSLASMDACSPAAVQMLLEHGADPNGELTPRSCNGGYLPTCGPGGLAALDASGWWTNKTDVKLVILTALAKAGGEMCDAHTEYQHYKKSHKAEFDLCSGLFGDEIRRIQSYARQRLETVVALVGIVSFWRRAAAAPDSKAAKAAIARAVKRARAWA